MNELNKQSTRPDQSADHTRVPGQAPGQRPDHDQGSRTPPDKPGDTAAEQNRSTQPDQKRGPSDAAHAPGDTGASARQPDVQHYMNLEKQGSNTPSQPAHGGADAVPLQTMPPTPDHTQQSSDATSGTTQGQLAADAGAHRPDGAASGSAGAHSETGRTTDTGHPVAAGHVAETGHAADTAHPAESRQPADSQRGPTPAAAHSAGAHDRAPDTGAAREAHETPADRALRLHLQPFGVTPEQARDYVRFALAPQLHLDLTATMRPGDIQRTGSAVSHLSPEQLSHLTAQAAAADAGGRTGRQTLDLSHQPVVPRFGMEHPIDLTPPPIIPKAFQIPRVWPEPVPKPLVVQPSPKPAEPTEYAKKMADSAAQGHPSHRLPDIPDAEKTKEATVGDVIDAVEEIFGLPKIKPDSDGTLNLGRDF